MDHYVEVRLLPDPEFKETTLMNILFDKLHRALATEGRGKVGVSFPQTQKSLGDTIRLHGTKDTLERMMDTNWHKGLMDYTNVSEILPVPENCKYRLVKRVQAKSSLERLYRRSVKKGWMTPEEAQEKIQSQKEYRLKAPFAQLTSYSTGQKFRLFIHHGETRDFPQPGTFSSYGLSNNATVPWF